MPSTQELFGDDSSSAEEEEEEEEKQVSTAKPSNEDSNETNDLSDDEDAPAPKPPKPAAPKEDTITYADDDDNAAWSIPTFPHNNNNNHVQPLILKLPNFMGIQTQPFTPEEYDPTQEQDYFGPQSVWNLMRYRYKNHAEDATTTTTATTRESNTRWVEWDDGSYTLHIGAEAFTIDLMDNTMRKSTTENPDNNNTIHDTSFPGLNGYLYVSHKASMGNNSSTTTTLECVHPLAARGTIQPTSLQSAAHKALTVSIRQQTMTKRAKIANYQTTQDPEKLKQERIKVKQDLEKAHVARGDRRQSGGPRSRPRRSRAYMEEEDEDDEDYDTTNIKAMKRRTYKDDDDDEDGDDDFGNDDDDDEEDEGDTFHRVRPHKKQARVEETKKDNKAGLFDDDDDDDDDEDGDDDDDEDLVRPVVKTSNKRNTQSLFDDDDDSE